MKQFIYAENIEAAKKRCNWAGRVIEYGTDGGYLAFTSPAEHLKWMGGWEIEGFWPREAYKNWNFIDELWLKDAYDGETAQELYDMWKRDNILYDLRYDDDFWELADFENYVKYKMIEVKLGR